MNVMKLNVKESEAEIGAEDEAADGSNNNKAAGEQIYLMHVNRLFNYDFANRKNVICAILLDDKFYINIFKLSQILYVSI